MKLCTFEVQTHLGRHRRVGAVDRDGVVDVHFAVAHHMESYRLAEALAPPSLLCLLDGGVASMQAAQNALAFLPPEMRIGKNGETLRYYWDQVRLLTPLPDARSVRDFFAFEAHVKRGFEKRGEPMPKEWQSANNRTHRKLLAIDGHTAFIGGAGIADHWMKDTKQGPRWRDDVFCVEGEAVAGLISTFSENWLEASGEILSGDNQFNFHTLPKGKPALVVSSTPSGGGTHARILFQALLNSARKSISVTTPYFLPDHSAHRALIDAASRRRVRVRILTAGPHIDHPIVRRLSRHNSRHLLKAGAEIYEYQPSMIHAKLMVIDDAWCVFGSTNFDHRSFALNDEVNIASLDRELAAVMNRDFTEDLQQSRKLALEMLQSHSLTGEAELAAGAALERES